MATSTIRKAIRFPEAVKRKVAATITRPFTFESFPGQSHIDCEWDNLVILDGCRYDVFVEYNPFEVDVQLARSNASHTTDFLDRNFSDEHYDTVYVTASPQLVGRESRFHRVVHVWESHWDDELRTVLPRDVTDNALSTLQSYPDKRLVVHYMQPHYPFIGPTGRKLAPHATFTGGLRRREYLSIWELLSSGTVTEELVRRAYEENLELVLEDVAKLLEGLDGKTVLTSDHGNLFGERVSPLPISIYGHPPNMPAKGLIEVPLVEIPCDQRRTTTAEPPEDTSSIATDVETHLEDLGYLQ